MVHGELYVTLIDTGIRQIPVWYVSSLAIQDMVCIITNYQPKIYVCQSYNRIDGSVSAVL